MSTVPSGMQCSLHSTLRHVRCPWCSHLHSQCKQPSHCSHQLSSCLTPGKQPAWEAVACCCTAPRGPTSRLVQIRPLLSRGRSRGKPQQGCPSAFAGLLADVVDQQRTAPTYVGCLWLYDAVVSVCGLYMHACSCPAWKRGLPASALAVPRAQSQQINAERRARRLSCFPSFLLEIAGAHLR
jgi:hypothetical protein